MKKIRQGLVPALEWVLVAICLLGLARFILAARVLSSGRMGVGWFEERQRRLEGLRRALPPSGVVGYVTDRPVALQDRELSRRFYTAQYALCPLVLVREDARPPSVQTLWVVGDYEGALEGPLPWERVRDFGDGLLLFRKGEP